MIILYGIKNCDSVKKAKSWLAKHNIAFLYHDFREQGLNESILKKWLQTCSQEQLINKKSTSWRNLSDNEKASLDSASAIALCIQHETLIKRPVLEHQGKVYFGFDEKLYTTLFTEQ